MRPFVGRTAALAFALVVACSTSTLAQTVQGTVVDDETGDPISAAEIDVIDADENVVLRAATDEEGMFELVVPDEALYRLSVSRFGYATSISTVFSVPEGQIGFADLSLGIAPILLDPIVAVVDGTFRPLARDGFYMREQVGVGYFLTPEEVDRRPGLITLDDLFRRTPGVSVGFDGTRTSFDLFTSRGGPCRLSVAIDRVLVQVGGRRTQGTFWSNMVSVTEIAALEVYTTSAGVPEWLKRNQAECGAVVIWTNGHIGRKR